jgi:hypothetical protein
MYLAGITGVAMAGDTFEIDDNGEPYWTITLYSKKIGIRGNGGRKLSKRYCRTKNISAMLCYRKPTRWTS